MRGEGERTVITSMPVALPVTTVSRRLLLGLVPGLLTEQGAVDEVDVSPYEEDSCSAFISMAAGDGAE